MSERVFNEDWRVTKIREKKRTFNFVEVSFRKLIKFRTYLILCQTPPLFLCVCALSDVTVQHWCCASLQHQGPVQCSYSSTNPIMHCHKRAHTPMRETRKDTFLQHRRLSVQPITAVTLASCVLVVQRVLTLVLWTQTPASCSFSPSDQGTFPIWWRQINSLAAEKKTASGFNLFQMQNI